MLTKMIHNNEPLSITGYDSIRDAHKTAGCSQGKMCNGPGCKVKRVREHSKTQPRFKLRYRFGWPY